MNRFSFQQIKHKWILLVSIVVFFVTYFIDLLSPREKPVSLFVMGAVVATLIAAVWAIINYVSHLKVNPLYKDNSLTNQPIFQEIQHQYLFFWGSISVLLGVVDFIVVYVFRTLMIPVLVDLGVTLTCDGVGFYLVFFVYLLLDKLLLHKR